MVANVEKECVMRIPPRPLGASLVCALLAWGATPSAAMAEEEILLVSGERVTGEVITEGGTTLEVRRLVLVKHNAVAATVTIAKDQITHREKVPSAAIQYQARAKDTPDTLEGHVALARWSISHCLVKEAADNAKRADDIDSDNPLVIRLYKDLGYIKAKDAWVREDEYLAANGLVDYQGRIMTPAEAEKAKAIYAATQEHDAAAQAVKDDEFYLAHGEDKVKELTDKLDKEKADQSKAKDDATAAKTRIDDDNKKLADLANQPPQPAPQPTGGRRGGNQQPQLTPVQQTTKDLADATAAYQKATDEQHAADHLVASDQRKLTTLQAAVAKAKDDLPIQQARVKKAEDDYTALTGKPYPVVEDKAADATKSADAKGDAKGDGKADAKADQPKAK
jgi:hypothetical protein